MEDTALLTLYRRNVLKKIHSPPRGLESYIVTIKKFRETFRNLYSNGGKELMMEARLKAGYVN